MNLKVLSLLPNELLNRRYFLYRKTLCNTVTRKKKAVDVFFLDRGFFPTDWTSSCSPVSRNEIFKDHG